MYRRFEDSEMVTYTLPHTNEVRAGIITSNGVQPDYLIVIEVSTGIRRLVAYKTIRGYWVSSTHKLLTKAEINNE